MKRLFLIFAFVTSAAQAADGVPFYIGTYTSPGGSQGIYRAVLDVETGELSQPELAAEAPGPSFVAIHPNGQFLYAVHEPTEGDVSAYAIDADGKLKKLNTQSSGGGGPCHVSVSPDGRNVFTASYGAGSLACLPLKADGSLDEASAVIENTGSGPDKARQEGPHLHAIYADGENSFVYACDLGTDEVLIFRLNSEEGTLTPTEPRSAKVPPGGGPRHLAMHPNGRFAFANNEMTSAVTAFSRDPKSGALSPKQTVSTLPDGKPVPGNSTAEIFLHPNGKWLYVSNRGHDSIAAFNVGQDGELSLIEIASAGVSVPRGFGIDPSGRWLVAAGQKSNDLTALAIDPKTGKLSPGPNRVSVDKPVCVAFVQP
ncbi:MAG: lactonase family protein [Planctomycetota bacterium]|nr:lactonase family protein [Planctomycetaceae bacterium]MDQ3329560.1 lactonase family protein [Planctomycetota bacterium]